MRRFPLLAVIAALAACGEDAPDAAPVAETRTATDRGDVVVRLLDQGAEPRRVLHYELADWKGGKARIRMTMSMRTRFDADEEPHAVEIPVIELGASYTSDGVDERGNLRVAFTMGDMELVGADPEATEAFREQARRLSGLKGTSVITPGGCVLESSVDVPDSAPPAAKQMLRGLQGNMRQLSTPFPAQPVGPGARWEVVAPAALIGIRMDMTAAYRLEELTEAGGTIRIDLAMTGSGRPEIAGLEGVDAEIESMRAAGTGTLRLDCRDLIPRMEMEVRYGMAVLVPGERRVEQEMEMRLEISPAE